MWSRAFETVDIHATYIILIEIVDRRAGVRGFDAVFEIYRSLKRSRGAKRRF